MKGRIRTMLPIIISAIGISLGMPSFTDAEDLNAYFQEGTRAYDKGHYHEAINTWIRGTKAALQQGHHQAMGLFIGNMGVAYQDLGQYEEALEAFEQALAIQREIGDVKSEGGHLSNIGSLYDDLGQYEKALDYFEKALSIHREIGDLEGEGRNLGNIGAAYYHLGQFKKAIEYYKRGLAIHREIGNVQYEGNELGNIGAVYLVSCQYEEALKYFKRALVIRRKIGDINGEGRVLNNIGMVYKELGRYEECLEYLKQALAIQRNTGYLKGVANTFGNIGNVYSILGNHREALEYYKQALELDTKIGNVRGVGTHFSNIGSLYVDLGQYERALEFHKKALAIFREIGHLEGEGGTLGNIGVNYGNLGEHEKAIEYHKQALAIAMEIGDLKGQGNTLYNIGCDLLNSGRISQATKLLNSAVDVYEDIREQVNSGYDRTGFESTLPAVYGTLAAAHLASGRPEEALEAVERGRAKSFLELLGSRAAKIQRSENKIDQVVEIEIRLAELRDKQVKLTSVPAGAKTRSGRKALNQKISTLDKQRLVLIRQIRRFDPELSSLVVVDPPKLKEIRALLPPRAVLVEYFHPGKGTISGKVQDQLWIFILHSGGLHFKAVDVSNSELEKMLEEYSELVSNDLSDLKAIETTGANLYKWLIEPIEPISQLADSDTLLIVPWGPMFKIPFAALEPKGGKPLCADKNIVTAPSAGVYRYLVKKRSSGRKNILSIGNPKTAMAPLPGAEKEAWEISALFGNSKVYTRSKATEGLIKKDYAALGKPDVVHLACHGLFNESAPQLSHLALTPDQKNDGKLEMHELFDLDWRGVSLVTMSACSSGKGKLGAGDDLVGLTRGFMFAGAPSILCSLWDVDDEATRALMVSFYKNYLGGMSKPEALRRAQISMMNNKKWSHPYYWSAFVLFGDWE